MCVCVCVCVLLRIGVPPGAAMFTLYQLRAKKKKKLSSWRNVHFCHTRHTGRLHDVTDLIKSKWQPADSRLSVFAIISSSQKLLSLYYISFSSRTAYRHSVFEWCWCARADLHWGRGGGEERKRGISSSLPQKRSHTRKSHHHHKQWPRL